MHYKYEFILRRFDSLATCHLKSGPLLHNLVTKWSGVQTLLKSNNLLDKVWRQYVDCQFTAGMLVCIVCHYRQLTILMTRIILFYM